MCVYIYIYRERERDLEINNINIIIGFPCLRGHHPEEVRRPVHAGVHEVHDRPRKGHKSKYRQIK